MIVTRTPYRVSLIGGGSDYPAWFKDHRGAVLSMAISHYSYLTCRKLPPFFSHKSRFVWSKVEFVNETSEIEHPAIRECLKYLGVEDGLVVHHDGDIPARSGMGSSAAFTVGFLHALHALRGELTTKRQLALEAIEVDQDRAGDICGIQDHIASSFGGMNLMEFGGVREAFRVEPIILKTNIEERLLDHMLLFYTGTPRLSAEIAKTQVAAMPFKQSEMFDLVNLVDEAWQALARGDVMAIGSILEESWQIKRDLSPVITNDFVDSLHDRALRIGATGFKLLGAGAAGVILVFINPELRQSALIEFKDLVHIPFGIDRTGSQLVYFHGEGHA